MKKIYKNLLYCLLAIAAASIGSSCSNFLDENLITTESTQSFQTTDGINKLSVGVYQNLEYHFWYEWAYTLWNYGTDEMACGNDGSREMFNSYTSAFNSTTADGVAALWDNMYSGIATANTLIKNVPLYYDHSLSTYNNRLGEGYFLRGFNYFRLVEQFGGVPLVTEPVIGAQSDFERSSVEDTYNLIVSDLKQAYDLLPVNPEQTGSLTKYAAAHFLAKALLFRASEINDSWNSSYKTQDLNDVISYAKEVINARPLCSDFVALWNYTKPNDVNESVSEIVLAAQFSNDVSSQGRYGNQVHLYYPSIYQNLPGLARDISGDREFSRMRTTDYAIDIYDRVNDSRFWKSFITTYNCNNPNAAPTWGDYAPAGKTSGDRKFAGGEIGAQYIVNSPGDDRYTADNIGYEAPHTFVRFFSGEPQNLIGRHGNSGCYATKDRFIALSKFRDGSRNSIASQFGYRDGILARSAEDYLMVAEAYGRQGNYNDALPFINALRDRAGYANGEDREKHVDGGQAYANNPVITIAGNGGFGTGAFAIYCTKNTYLKSNNLTVAPTSDTKVALRFNSVADIFNSTREFYSELGATTDADKFMVFIMNERSRELMGELHRWPDLARCKQLEKRFKTFNDGSVIPGASFDPNKCYLRPLPQTYLDNVTRNGQPLSATEKQSMQNPGW